tara:strand:+ start:529 stop:1263 length:735 start_codon:yes stop_codon:yes gene_type:complete
MLATLINIITSPVDGFNYITKNFNWKHAFLPIVFLSIFNVISGTIMKEEVKEMNFDRASEWINNSDRMTDEQKDQALNSMEERMNGDPSIIGTIFIQDSIPPSFGSFPQWPIRILFWSLFALMAGNLFLGGGVSFGMVFTISSFAYLASVLEYIFKTGYQFITGDLMFFTGLGILNIGEQGAFINSFLTSLDLFAFWRVYLTGVGFTLVYNKSLNNCLGVLSGLWIFLSILGSGLGSFIASFFS